MPNKKIYRTKLRHQYHKIQKTKSNQSSKTPTQTIQATQDHSGIVIDWIMSVSLDEMAGAMIDLYVSKL